MSSVLRENFDFWPITTPILGSVTEDTAHKRNGAACAACAASGFNINQLVLAPTPGETYFYREAFRPSALPASSMAIWRIEDATGIVIELTINEAGEVRMWNPIAAAHPTESTPTILAGEYFVAEIMWRINASGEGSLAWKFNGVTKAAEQAMPMRNVGAKVLRSGNNSSTPAVILYKDDLAVNDSKGTENNTWLGVGPDPVPERQKCYIGADMAETETDPHPTEPAPYNEVVREEFEARAGKAMGIGHMGDPWSETNGPEWDGYFTGASERIQARGAIVLKSIGGPTNVIADVIAGKYDAGIVRWAEAAKAFGRPFFLRLWWEQNGTWFPWGRQACTGAEYVEAWQRFHTIVSAIAKNATFVWCPNAFTASFPEYNPYTGPNGNTYPGDAYVDWIGTDGYASENPHKLIGYPNGKELFSYTYESFQSRSPSKPIIICETSASEYAIKGNEPEPPKKAEWIRQLLQHTIPFEFPEIRAVVWFNWYIEEGGGRIDWPISSSPSATEKFKESVADPHYVGAPEATAGLRPGGKVPVPGGTQVIVTPPRPPSRQCQIPKLGVPLRLGGSSFVAVEQGSLDEIAACVYAQVATPRGSRIEEQDFGVEDPDFAPIPLDVSEWLEQIKTWEPRAEVATAQQIEDTIDLIELKVGSS